MNDIIAALHARKSIRAFEDRDVGEAERAAVIDAAIQAPTAGNQALYTIIDVRDRGIKEVLARSCDDQPFIAKAPMALVFLADCRRWPDAYRYAGVQPRKPGAGDLLLAVEDAMIAAQNAVVAAESLGLGSCYIGDILENHDEVVELLALDLYVVPISMLVFGYPTERQRERAKPVRFDRRFLVRRDRYSPLSEEESRAMFAAAHPEPEFSYDGWLRAFCERKYHAAFSLEMSASAMKYLEPFLEAD